MDAVYQFNDRIERRLNEVWDNMQHKPLVERIPFLNLQIARWQSDIQLHERKFQNLLKEGENNIDPEDFESELENERLAIGRLYLWIEEVEYENNYVTPESRDKSTEINTSVPSSDVIDDEPQEENLSYSDDIVPKEATDQLITIQQLAEFLQLSESYLYGLSAEGELDSIRYKLGNKVRFDMDEVKEWLRTKRR